MTTPLPREQFPVTEHYRYFDHAGISPLPRASVEAAQWFVDRMMRKGKLDYDELETRQVATREAGARLMGVPVNDLAFIKNTTEGLGFVSSGLEWSPGDRVIAPDLEFPSMIFPWLALRERGVQVDLIAPIGDGGTLPLAEFERVIAAGPPPKLVAVSWVQYGRGWRTDLRGLARLCHDAGALLCVDAIQGIGVLPEALADCDVDFAMGDGQKWMLGTEGLGFFYVAERVRDRLRPLEPGWASVPHRGEWSNLDFVWDDSSRRFEGGSYNMVSTMILGASLALLLDAGVDAIWNHVDGLCDHLVTGLTAIDGVRVLSDRSEAGRSSIVSFSVDGIAPEQIAERLQADHFVCMARAGGVRVAPHGYNTIDEIDALLAAVELQAAAHEKDR